jgi:hypothetical protein
MRVVTVTIAALALMGSAAAQAQGVYVETPPATVYVNPAPPVVVAPGAPVVVAPGATDYAYVPAPYAGSTVVVDARTGRSCKIEPNGHRWCWTP